MQNLLLMKDQGLIYTKKLKPGEKKYKITALALIDIKCKSFFMLSTNNR